MELNDDGIVRRAIAHGPWNMNVQATLADIPTESTETEHPPGCRSQALQPGMPPERMRN
jgi:hypothetical protein